MTLAHDHPDATSATAPSAAAQSVPRPWQPADPVILRPHNLLCLQGWEGIGYSPTFTANMDQVWLQLQAHPDTPVTLRTGLDVLCACCPMNTGPACRHDIEEASWITGLDTRTLTRLGLTEGATYPWQELQATIAGQLTGADLADHCAPCGFLASGMCARAIDRLRTGAGSQYLPPGTDFSASGPDQTDQEDVP